MASVPSERALFSSYKLWRKHADPDGLISASEFAEMDEDDKREALRELGGAVADAGGGADDDDDDEAEEPTTARRVGRHSDDDSDEEADEDEPDEEELEEDGDEPVVKEPHDEDDPLGGDVVELTDDIIDERTKDPYD